MVMEALVYILTLLFGVSTVIIIKNKRYKVVPFICLDIILTFVGFAITSFVILFVRNEALEALLIMSVFGLFLFLLGANDIYAVFRCNRKTVENLRFAEMLSIFAQVPGDVDSAA